MADEKQGAENRARFLATHEKGYDLYAGLEGGIVEEEGKLICFAWMFVLSAKDGKVGSARTATFELPEKVAKLVREGVELGEADDRVFDRTDSKRKGGTVGYLSKGVVSRTEYYRHAMVMALIPFMNEELY
ncbi:hypothetical protein GUITHDRAFT_118017 [Guillardia theta CCMP2712]|uniref:inosine/xanthosine triphosphatase n=1 Tax=Guillardia theta (strain CCMP2712) TaxID=905079 RepID=L1IJ79_GUITC|nr:hypothetical protein GUITHDRAFT_118017 [Guillardia theta CCMP2712]EKX35870.1 hypothetical protein GUITHDRAFT_118017 [Guillardia theta CCMP2712]|eukprot:XP_005822850.1 hypothetical protein GUITHDRAFT_118017 [Guillardia theta CCMP2712]